jgi:hypothetical protein
MTSASVHKNRVFSIDLIRGLAMIIMALDHTRDFFHKYSFLHDAADLEHTSPAIFFTRWITHFCAPTFIFLAGTSAFLSGQKKSRKELSAFLFKRGLWLILLEITAVSFGWLFNPLFNIFNLQVIWAIGVCMILLSILIYVPSRILPIIALLLIAAHNLLDNIHVSGNTLPAFLWSILHEFQFFKFGPLTIFMVYPVMPWAGLMTLGYCFGRLYLPAISTESRKKKLVIFGLAGIAAFILIRYLNGYGDPSPWSIQKSGLFTLLSFLNVSKYPPSLLFILMTISPLMLLLAYTEKIQTRFSNWISVFGKVPMFYYLIHIYVIHLAAMITGIFQGYAAKNWIIVSGWVSDEEGLKGFGFSLPGVYLIWFLIIIILYFPCRRYERYKTTHDHWWLSYL